MQLAFDELVRYTNDERQKWRAWFLEHPDATGIELQPDGQFTTVGALVDHIFLVERRHLQRLQELKLDTTTGLSGRHAPPLFDYGASVRRELEQYAADLSPDEAGDARTFTFQSGPLAVTPRKLLFHCLLHETRHWAQIALAIRRVGLTPPGNHDLLFSKALK